MNDQTANRRAFIPVGDAWVKVDHIVSVRELEAYAGQPRIVEVMTVGGFSLFDNEATIAQVMDRIKEVLS